MVNTRIQSFSNGAAFVKRCGRYRAQACAGIAVGLSLFAFVSNASASRGREEGDKAFRAGQYKEAAIAWSGGAWNGDSEQQELLADLLLGPHTYRVMSSALSTSAFTGTSYSMPITHLRVQPRGLFACLIKLVTIRATRNFR